MTRNWGELMPIPKEDLLKAIRQMRENSKPRKFLQSVELLVGLRDIDLKKPENRISEDVVLPHGLGKQRKVAIFAEGDLALRAKEAGVDLVLGRDDINALQKDKKRAKKIAEEFDFFLAQADLMPLIGRALGPVLGPRGKIPKPVPPSADPKGLLERYRKTIRIRTREQPVVHAPIGTEQMGDEQLADNASAMLEALEHKLEKGMHQIGSVYIKTTMGKAVRVI